jgi:hypothetical protein
MTMTHTTPASKMEPAYVLAPLGVFFLCCQLILCRVARFCPWSNHWLFPYAAEAGDYLPNVLGSMAMASIPDEPSAVVLMLYLIVLNNSMAAYDREKISLRYLWTAVNIICFAYRAQNAIGRADLGSKGRYVGAYAIVATVLCAYAYCNIFVRLASACNCKHYSEAIVEHMRSTEHVPQTKDQYNASTLVGYQYVVLLEPKKTTVDQIFSSSSSSSSLSAAAAAANATAAAGEQGEGEQQQLKDLCLSFSLFQLLFCLYHGVPWYHEASGQKSRKLVLEGLLGRAPPPPPPVQQLQQRQACYEQSTRRGFRVVEVELAFLHDHIHGGDILWSPGSGACQALYYVLKTVMAVIMYLAGLGLYLTCDRPRPPVVWVAVIAPLLLYMLFDLLQVAFYCRSDRWMVSRMCSHPADACWQDRYFGGLVDLIRRPKLLNNCSNFYCLDRVHQYSLLEETTPHSWDNNGARSITTPFHQSTSLYSHRAKPSGPVALPPSLKLRVAEVLGGTRCPVDVPREVERAQCFRGGEPKQKIDIILKWHVATSYCEMMMKVQEEDQAHEAADHRHIHTSSSPSREVAVVLSKYCAYLVAFRPELLPCPDTITRRTFCNVLGEVTSFVGGQQAPERRLNALDERRVAGYISGSGFPRDTADILTHGLRLGHLLITEIQNRQDLWVILESIWLKLLLSVAPQESTHDATYAKTHAKYLAQGGEFLTYLWAMLSHAGIQKHSYWPPCIRNETVSPWVNA